MDDNVRVKTRSCAGGETSSAASASRIIAQQWAARRRQQACEQMVLTTLDLDRRDRESELLALARLHAVSMLDASFLHGGDGGPSGRRRARSPERALVRRIAREWAASASTSPLEGAARGRAPGAEEWLGESERERVRSVRERVRMACQGYDGEEEAPRLMRGRPQARADVVVTRMAVERQRELQGLSEHRAVSAFAHRGRIQSFLRGRFFCSGRPMNDERSISMTTRELGHVRQSHLVSRLREEVRFGTESITNDQSTLVALSTQTNSIDNEYDSVTPQVVSDDNNHIENATRGYEILTQQSMQNEDSHIENNVANSNDAHQTDFAQEQIDRYEDYSDSGSSEQDNDHSSYAFPAPSNNGVQREVETYGGQQSDSPWSRDISGTQDGHDNTFVHRDEEWLIIDSQEPTPNWQLGRSFPSSRNVNRLHPSDDDVYGIELRELLSRRSVSNLLSSGFRESLDQLIQSYIQRQEHDPHNWNFEEQRPTTGLLNEDPIEIRIDEQNRAERDTAPQSSTMLPDQILFPQQRQWHIELPHHNWFQQSMHRSEFDWDTIHILRDELTGVQRGMTNMQQMLEACMEMQIELQRSIKQEVSAALNRSLTMQDEETLEDGSQWKLARKGTCCICCDNQIDSLLYRCGHMCTCSKCASELLHGVGKCPLCRAPIIEVIRPYCIM
ncbi:unnamed protein product [Miscanthus lutarioriparius]|uniref:RING-type domain-containing protein n=1 Tax=Miscanthus lutarioriparius TaxID=422564 RepID=A0A811MNG2_9POAL|nr:unnamed protein product [Miscanthus lutarioriparius]